MLQDRDPIPILINTSTEELGQWAGGREHLIHLAVKGAFWSGIVELQEFTQDVSRLICMLSLVLMRDPSEVECF